MLSKLKDFFQSEIKPSSESLTDHQRKLASAALLIEVAVVDNKLDQSEQDALQTVLTEKFQLTEQEAQDLYDLAKAERDQATSTYQFTQLINQNFSSEEKFELVKDMWLIAFADNVLDKYEEYTIRKVADLIHVPHSDFIRAKHLVRP